MLLQDFREAFAALPFPTAIAATSPSRETVLAARAIVGAAIADDDFLVDCIGLELSRIRNGNASGLDPFVTIPETGIRLAFGYWAPGATARPHEHTAWTITAVCRNELAVKTFAYDESYRTKKFVPKHRFQANAGSVGFIFDPCIHEPLNTSERWSLSLHVLSPRDGVDDRADDALWRTRPEPRPVDDASAQITATRRRHDFVDLLASILAAAQGPTAQATLRAALSIASSGTRRRFTPARSDGESSEARALAPWRLARVHPDLELTDHCENGLVSLSAETAAGTIDGLVVSDVARQAVSFAAKTPLFDVQSLPGSLSASEREFLAEALEETGFFMRVPE
jgi:hypothetical protein